MEGGRGTVDNDDFCRCECLEALDTDVTEATSANHHRFCARIKGSRCLLDRVISGETGISQGRNIFGVKARVELDNGTGARLEKVCHPTIDGDARKSRVRAVHIIAGTTGAAEATGNQRMNNNCVTDSYIADRRSNLLDPASVLMAQRIRQRYSGFLCPLSFDDMQVGAAEARAANAHNDIEGSSHLWFSYFGDFGKLVIFKKPYSFHMFSPSGYASFAPAFS